MKNSANYVAVRLWDCL